MKKNKAAQKKEQNPYVPSLYKVTDFHRETSDIFTLTVAMKNNHEPGQFVQVSMPGFGEAPISICSDSRDFIRLNIREVGNVTSALSKLRKNDSVLIRGPYGKGYPMRTLKGNNLIIIGGGCGVAPLKGVIDYVENHRNDYKDVHLFLGYRSPDDIIFKRELEEWKKKYKMEITVDKNAHGKFCYDAKEGFITDAIKNSTLTNENKVSSSAGLR